MGKEKDDKSEMSKAISKNYMSQCIIKHHRAVGVSRVD